MHHAILIVGERVETDSHIQNIFDKLGVRVLGNPDVFLFELPSFSVDDARALSERAITRAFGEKKYFIIKAERFTTEAQNALLKTFEDPVPDTHFILAHREPGVFLPTLLSRMELVRAGGELEESEAKKFLKKGLKQRIEFAKKFEGALPDFLDSLLLELRLEGSTLESLKKVLALRKYARDTAALPRLIIEHLALVI